MHKEHSHCSWDTPRRVDRAVHTPGRLDKHILAVDRVAFPAAGTPAIAVVGNSPLPVAALVVDKVEKQRVETAVPLMSIQGGRPLHVRGA